MGSSEETSLLDTIDRIYAAALDPQHWDGALTEIARLCNAQAAGLRIEGATVAQRWIGLDAKFNAAYVEHYWRDDPWVAPARTGEAGMAGFGEMLVSRKTLEKSSFYNELSKPYGLDDLVGGLISKTPDQLISMGVMGPLRVRFDERQKRIVERLIPHLRRALLIGEQLASAPFPLARPPLDERLRREYGLTVTEARVAVYIGRGLAPKEVAAALGTSWNTVRTHLRQVFAKTETSRQPELVVLLGALERKP